MTDTELTMQQWDHALRNGYWLLSDWLKTIPKIKKDEKYVMMRTRSHLQLLEREIKSLWLNQTKTTPALKPINDGDVMTVEVWLDWVKSNGFIDYDGFGSLATTQGVSDISISPSDITVFKLEIPSWCTHIVWYNR